MLSMKEATVRAMRMGWTADGREEFAWLWNPNDATATWGAEWKRVELDDGKVVYSPHWLPDRIAELEAGQ
jgi:hypothetical protein